MFENVLVGVDGSSGGRDAVALAARLLGLQGKLTLVGSAVGTGAPQESASAVVAPGPVTA